MRSEPCKKKLAKQMRFGIVVLLIFSGCKERVEGKLIRRISDECVCVFLIGLGGAPFLWFSFALDQSTHDLHFRWPRVVQGWCEGAIDRLFMGVSVKLLAS